MLAVLVSEQPDLILTTGASSMGKRDLLPSVLREIQAELLFHGVAIRPGEPILMAEWSRGPVLFGLSGDPISTAVGWRFFGEPFLRALRGRPGERPFRVTLEGATGQPASARCFLKGRLDLSSGKARVLYGQEPTMVRPLVRANAWIVLPEDGAVEGDQVEAYPLLPLPYEGERSL
jgi:molybdopterin molybdotransferase